MKKGITIFCVLVVAVFVSAYVFVDKDSSRKKEEAKPIRTTIKKEKLPLDEFNAEKPETLETKEIEKDSYPQGYFKNPMDGEIRLSGTFGELRSNHFHAGLDMRTGGVEGKPIYATADGYVARINVSTYGYGKALYIRHPNGYTTVYGHLQKYTGDIAKFTEDAQYARKDFGVQLFPSSGKLLVKKGDIIAYSGNSGGSGGPHLHFEIRSTTTEATINPLLFGLDIKDTRKPKIRKVFIHTLADHYKKEMGHYEFRLFDETNPIDNKTIEVTEGTYGIAAELRDEFLAAGEKLGLNYMKLFVNNTEIFTAEIEKFYFHETRYMNCHMDFATHKNDNIKATKFWKDQGNKLNFYKTIEDGKIKIGVGEVKILKIWVKDLSGNVDEIKFTLKGKEAVAEGAFEVATNSTMCYPDKQNHMNGEEYSCNIPSNSLYYPFRVPIKVENGNAFSKKITFGRYDVPMHQKMTCKIKTSIPKGQEGKAYVVESFKGSKYPISCYVSSGWAKFATKDFGTYYVDLDTVNPKIKVINSFANKPFKFYITDVNGSGIKSFIGTINGEWFLLDWDSKSGMLEGEPRNKLTKGNHKLKLVVTDECNNSTTFEKTITIQ